MAPPVIGPVRQRSDPSAHSTVVADRGRAGYGHVDNVGPRDAAPERVSDRGRVRLLLPPGAGAVAGWSREQLASAFRSVFTSGSEGPPAWTRELEVGDDEGYFGPDSTVWALHANLATLVAGVRSLLVQS